MIRPIQHPVEVVGQDLARFGYSVHTAPRSPIRCVRNPTKAAYARSDLFERRRRLMDDWASAIDTM